MVTEFLWPPPTPTYLPHQPCIHAVVQLAGHLFLPSKGPKLLPLKESPTLSNSTVKENKTQIM